MGVGVGRQGGCSVTTLMLSHLAYLLPRNTSSLSVHGINEKVSVQNYQNQVKFIFEFIQNADTYKEPVPHLHEL